jgi:CBS domain containing-hemolysin-like protein
VTALNIILAFVLVAANGFFVATEFAIARVRPSQVAEWVREGRPGARSAQHAVEHIDAYLAACQLGITVASLGLGAIGEPAFGHLFEPLFGEDTRLAGVAAGGALAFLIITVMHVVLGELSPKSLAIARTERTVLWVAPPMRALYFVAKPLVDFFNGLGNLVLRPFGIPPAREVGHAPHTEDEIRVLVRESRREGLIDPEEQEFTDNVLTFGDRRAREVMVPRHRVQLVTTDQDLRGTVERIGETGLTRLPLCEPNGGLDSCVGLLHAKDLLVASQDSPDVELRELARPIERVAESMLIDELLERLRRRREHFALVVDEYGTAVGIVTLEDVLEEIVGEIEDEFDPDAEDPIVQRDGATLVAGWAPVRMVADRLGVEIDEAHEATLGGYLLERLGRPPEVGETVTFGGRELEVTAAGEASIEELRVTEPPHQAAR